MNTAQLVVGLMDDTPGGLVMMSELIQTLALTLKLDAAVWTFKDAPTAVKPRPWPGPANVT